MGTMRSTFLNLGQPRSSGSTEVTEGQMGSMRSSKFNWGQQVSIEVNMGQPTTYGSLKVNQGLLVLMMSTGVNQGPLLSILSKPFILGQYIFVKTLFSKLDYIYTY